MISKYLGQAASYRATAGWLVADIVRTLGLRILALAGLGLLVILARVVTFGGFLAFLRSAVVETPLTLPVLGVELPRLGAGFWAPVILISGVVLGALSYAEVRWRVALSARYAMSAMDRALGVLSQRDLEAQDTRASAHRFKVRLLASDSWSMMRAALPLLTMILPLIQLAIAGAILIYMSGSMALLILGLAVAYVVPFFFLNRRVMRAARLRQESAPGLKSGVLDALDRIAYPQYREAAADEARRVFFGNEHLHGQMSALQIVRTTRGAITLLNSVALALMMFALVLLVGGGGSQTVLLDVVAYGLVLLHAYAAANTCTRQVAAFNRFFSQFQRYVRVLAPERAPRQAAGPRRPLALRLGPGRSLPGSAPSLKLGAGQVAAVFHPLRATIRASDAWLAGLGLGRRRHSEVFVAPPASDLPDLTLRQIAGDATDARLADLLGTAAAAPAATLDTPWRQIAAEAGPGLALALAVAPALADPPVAILVAGDAWRAVPDAERAQIVDLVPEAAWLVDAGGTVASLTEDVDAAVFVGEQGPVGMGSRAWALAAIAEDETLVRRQPRPVETFDDMDELEEDMS